MKLLLAVLATAACFAQQPPLIDTHNDVTSRTLKGADIGVKSAEGHTDVPRMREGGVSATFFAVYVGGEYVKENRAAHRALEMIDTVRYDIVEKHAKDFQLALTAADIEAARKKKKIAALMGLEGGHAIEDSLRLLRDYYALGIRYMTLTHANTNTWADSSGDLRDEKIQRHNGLTAFGKDVVKEMNRLGMMVDISHVADKTFWDVLDVSTAPVFASHSSCRALSNIARNMNDEMIVALAKKGGVVQINFGCEFLSQKSADSSGWIHPELGERAPVARASLEDVVAHIEHIRKIAGVDAIGIGSDYDGVECTPVGLDDVSKFPALTRALKAKGYKDADIRKIYGGNVLRVMRAVEKEAKRGGR